jgi:hypothetical protein
VSYTDLWPVALARSIYNKFNSTSTMPEEDVDEMMDEDAEVDVISGKKSGRRAKANKKPRSVAKRGVNGKN